MTARKKRGRNISGIVLLDKPVGITSNTALQIVKRLYQAQKAGHTGSLDPLASGLLPICLGEATKISPFLLEADKHYAVSIQLGVRTRTGDAEGETVETKPVSGFDDETITNILKVFTGRILQVPPMHSAIKRNGQPLYKLAHQGIEVEREPRAVSIYRLHLVRNAGDVLDLEVSCSKGTYIRTLAEDIGNALGVGGHVAALRRTGVGPFLPEQMVTLARLDAAAAEGLDTLDAYILPMEHALEHWPDVCLSDEMAHYVRQGHPVFVPRAPASGWVRLRTAKQAFMGVGCVLDDGRVAPKRLVVA